MYRVSGGAVGAAGRYLSAWSGANLASSASTFESSTCAFASSANIQTELGCVAGWVEGLDVESDGPRALGMALGRLTRPWNFVVMGLIVAPGVLGSVDGG